MIYLQRIALILTIIGALNWGLVGIAGLDLVQVDFYGFCPMNAYTKCTSLFLRRDFAFRSKYEVQPVNGWGNLWSMNRSRRKKAYKDFVK